MNLVLLELESVAKQLFENFNPWAENFNGGPMQQIKKCYPGYSLQYVRQSGSSP